MGFEGKHHSIATKELFSEQRKGKGNPHWKGGKMMVDGYLYIYKPEHPNATIFGYVAEHRLNMESKLGRLLDKKEVVHHIDGNRLNNSIENLKLFKSTGIHTKECHIFRDKEDGRFSKCA